MFKKIKTTIKNKLSRTDADNMLESNKLPTTKFEKYQIDRFLIVISPILVSSIMFSAFGLPYQTVSMWLATMFGLLACASIFIINKKISTIGVFLILIAIILAIVYALFFDNNNTGMFFSIFGYNFAEWNVMTIISLGVLSAYFFDNNVNKKEIFILALPVLYSLLNIILIQLSKPVLSLAYLPLNTSNTVYNYVFVYSLVIFVMALLSFVLRVTGHKVVSLDISGWLKKMLLFIFVVLSINFLYATLQNIAFTKYLSAINYLKSEDIVSARTNIDQAIAIMPMDIFFIDRILIYGYEFNKIISLDPRNEDKARQLYKDTVTAQLQDGLSAIKHNPYNYNNYVVLANLYSEKAITEYFNFVNANSSVQSVQVQSLTNSSDETYLSAIEYYDKAIKVSQDDAAKAEIEALKAILSFKLQKIESFEKSMDKALSLNPKSKSALFLKSQYLGLKGQYKEASNLAFSILSGDEQDLEIYKHIAKMLFVQEDYVESSKYFLLYYRDSGQKDIESLYNAALAIKKSKTRIEDFEILLQTLEKILGPDNQAFIELKSKTK